MKDLHSLTFSLTKPSKAKEQARTVFSGDGQQDYYGGKERALLSKENRTADQYEDRAKRGGKQ